MKLAMQRSCLQVHAPKIWDNSCLLPHAIDSKKETSDHDKIEQQEQIHFLKFKPDSVSIQFAGIRFHCVMTDAKYEQAMEVSHAQ
ncbi:MAG TPA: hypothetical protein VFA41_05305 [Ktedonobacteraceae bacterium]|jgi:hypothetical protein|nr:hypothetical protein [Ktedonobacteraceae bacterium]